MTSPSDAEESNQSRPEDSTSSAEAAPIPPRGRRGRPLGSVNRRSRQATEAGMDAALSIGGSLQETIKNSLYEPRDHVVMVRVSRNALLKLDELVECGLLSSRSTAAAFLIAEGIRSRTDLYEKIAAQTEVIREAREHLQRLLEE